MKFLYVLLLASLHITAIAQPVIEIADPNAKARLLNASFSAINVSDGIMLYLTQGDESVAVSSSDAKYEDRFKTEVENGILKIYFDNKGFDWNLNGKRKLKAYVSFKTLNKLNASGGSNVILTTPMDVEFFQMKFTSGTLFTGKITAKELEVIQNSGSEINISGSANKFQIETTSGAIFKGYDFAVDYCTAKATSGGAVRISVKKELDAKANSGGAIHYKGEAVIRDVNVNSGGVVKKAK